MSASPSTPKSEIPERLGGFELLRCNGSGGMGVVYLAREETLGRTVALRLRVNGSLRNKESSSDLVQSVCRDVLAGLHGFRYRGESSFKAWLFKAALNKIRKKQVFYRAHKRDADLEVGLSTAAGPDAELLTRCYATLSPSNVAAARESAERLEEAFEALPEDYREVLTLARIAGLSHAEIAEHMGRSVAASRVLLSRALARLAAVLKGLEVGGRREAGPEAT